MVQRYALRRLWLVIGWGLIALAVWLSLTPRLGELVMQVNDKVGHFLAYAGLMLWWARLVERRWRLAALLVLLGLGMEIAQSYVPGRDTSALDMLANTLGVALGLLVDRWLPDWLAWLDRQLTPRRA